MAAGLEAIADARGSGRHGAGALAAAERAGHRARAGAARASIGVIYESRPNVTADAGALCLKAGNAAILRGGSESFFSSRAILACLQEGLREAGLPEAAMQAVPTTDRAAVGIMLTMTDFIDVIVPRGGPSLIERVQQESRIPVFAHRDGICHVYLHAAAEPEMARRIVLNAKMRRTSVCGAAETLLVDREAAARLLPGVLDDLIEAGCEVRGDPDVLAMDARVVPASDADWSTEYLDAILSVKLVDGHRCGDRARQPLRLAPHRHHRHRGCRPRRSASSPRSTARSCCTTPRPSSPTAASSAWAPRSASRPAGCTRAARSGSSS